MHSLVETRTHEIDLSRHAGNLPSHRGRRYIRRTKAQVVHYIILVRRPSVHSLPYAAVQFAGHQLNGFTYCIPFFVELTSVLFRSLFQLVGQFPVHGGAFSRREDCLPDGATDRERSFHPHSSAQQSQRHSSTATPTSSREAPTNG